MGIVFEVEMAPNCTSVGVVVVAPTELAVSFTDVVVSLTATEVPDDVSEAEIEMTSPPATGKRKDAVPAAPETKVIGVPLMHCTLRPALAANCPLVRATHISTRAARAEEQEMLLVLGTVISADALAVMGAE